MSIHEVVQGIQKIRRTEGIVYTLTTTNWVSTPTSPTVTITREDDGTDVTSTFIPSGSPSVATDTITLPEILPPASAELGMYRVDVQFEAGSFSPGLPFFMLDVEK